MKKAIVFMLVSLIIPFGAILSSCGGTSDIPQDEYEEVTVYFDSNGGNYDKEITIIAGQTIDEPKNVEKEGYTLDGWFYNGEKRDFDQTINESIILTAEWTPIKTIVYFDCAGGEIKNETLQYTYDEKVILPIPTRNGYIFEGWYNGETKVESGRWEFTQNLTLTAKWIKENIKVELVYSTGEPSDFLNVKYGGPYILPTKVNGNHEITGRILNDKEIPMEGDSWKFTKDNCVLYPIWSTYTYKLRVEEPDGHTVYSKEIDLTIGSNIIINPPNIDYKTSRYDNFYGWYYNGIRITNENGFMLTSWVPNSENDTLYGVFGKPIRTIQDLRNVSNDLGGSYLLLSDIDLNGLEWVPIGTKDTPFTGVFNGFDHTISNFKVTKSYYYSGLFGYCQDAVISNLTVDGGAFEYQAVIEDNGESYVGLVAGYFNYSFAFHVIGRNAKFSIEPRLEYLPVVNGIVGFTSSRENDIYTFSYVYNFSNITISTEGFQDISGITTGSVKLKNCVNFGNIENMHGDASGMVGDDGSFSGVAYLNCINYGNISSVNISTGIGRLYGSAENCINFGEIKGEGAHGLFRADYYSNSIINCCNYGDVFGSQVGHYYNGAVGLGRASGIGAGALKKYVVNYGNVYAKAADGIGGVDFENTINFGTVKGQSVSAFGGGGDIVNSANYGDLIFDEKFNFDESSAVALGTGYFQMYNAINICDIRGFKTAVGGFELNRDKFIAEDCFSYTDIRAVYGSSFMFGKTNLYECKRCYYGGTFTEIPSEETTIPENPLSIAGFKTSEKTNLEKLFTNQMSFDTNVWELYDIDIKNGKYPMLKGTFFEDVDKIKKTDSPEKIFKMMEEWEKPSAN